MDKYKMVAAFVTSFGLPEVINETPQEATEKQEETTSPTSSPILNMVCAARHLLDGILD